MIAMGFGPRRQARWGGDGAGRAGSSTAAAWTFCSANRLPNRQRRRGDQRGADEKTAGANTIHKGQSLASRQLAAGSMRITLDEVVRSEK